MHERKSSVTSGWLLNSGESVGGPGGGDRGRYASTSRGEAGKPFQCTYIMCCYNYPNKHPKGLFSDKTCSRIGKARMDVVGLIDRETQLPR